MNIYIDSNIVSQYIEPIDAKIITHFGKFQQSVGPKKVVFHAPFPRHNDFIDLERVFNQSLEFSDQIILLVSELHDVTTDFIEKFDNPKIVYFLNGDLNFKLNHAKIYQWNNWFETTSDFYKKNLSLLDKLVPYQSKPKFFDLLLGQERPHREQIFNYIAESNLKDKVIMTYMKGIQNSFQSRSEDEWLWEQEGLEIPDWPMRHTITKVKYYDQLISLSQIIPISIYNQTSYSLVAETWGTDNRFTFNTEKIVKPILAERLFLVASNQYYLHNLRVLGFKTFDGIIDESYDREPCYIKRCAMICEQIEYLLNQSQENILTQCKAIVEHNKKLMLETDWRNNFIKELKSVLLDRIEQN